MQSLNSILRRTASVSWRASARMVPRPGVSPNYNPMHLRCRQPQIRRSSGPRQLADDPRWLSVVDNPAKIVRVGRKHGAGLIVLGTVPV